MERTGKFYWWWCLHLQWANLRHAGVVRLLLYTVGSNSLNLEALSAAADSFATDGGTAVPDAGILSVLGGSNLNTSATGSERGL